MKTDQKKLLIISEYLKNTSISIDELVDIMATKNVVTSSSSIQRYLNDTDFIDTQFGPGVAAEIKKALTIRKQIGNIVGGENSFKNNKPTRNQAGQFIGVAPDKQDNKIDIKRYHTSIFGRLVITFPNMNLNDIAVYCNSLGIFKKFVTKDYVFDCLRSKYIYEAGFTEQEIDCINDTLVNNRYTIK